MDAQFYFAWVDAPGTAGPQFDAAFARSDETVVGFKFGQNEGEFATLEITAKGRGIGLLSASRKTWAWLSCQVRTTVTPLFFGRLIGVQTVRSEDGLAMVLNLTAEPIDYIAQKKALANSLRTLPRYDKVFIDQQSWDDDDLVLEGYPSRYHVDPVTHVVTTSDEIIGEDGVLEFLDTDPADTLQNGFAMGLANVPASSQSVTADLKWTQKATGSVELSPPTFSSYTFSSSDWPASGASVGQGWVVTLSSCVDANDATVRSSSSAQTIEVNFGDWDALVGIGFNPSGAEPTTDTITLNTSDDFISAQGIKFPSIVTRSQSEVKYSLIDVDGGPEGEEVGFVDEYGIVVPEVLSISESINSTDSILPLHSLTPAISVNYSAARDCTDSVSFTLVADIQPVIGDPGSERALDPIQLSSVNLSDELDSAIPISDLRLRSYICTDRGQQSLQYLIARAQVALLHAARCVQMDFVPSDWTKIEDISLRKNARVHRPEIPGGVAEGKITSYSLTMERGSNKPPVLSVTAMCAVGNGGTITEVGGTPVYDDGDYVEDDYHEVSGGTELFDSSVGYTPPLFAADDDGLDFVAGISAADAIEQDFAVTNTAATQEAAIKSGLTSWLNGTAAAVTTQAGTTFSGGDPNQQASVGDEMVTARDTAVNDFLDTIKTEVTFKLKSMSAAFANPYPITVTELKVPTMISLDAA